MCLALPAQIIQVLPDNRALIQIGGISKEISIVFLEAVAVGDYVIIHAGYALTRLDEQEAKKTLALFAQMAEGALE